jgi:hypothetical protein
MEGLVGGYLAFLVLEQAEPFGKFVFWSGLQQKPEVWEYFEVDSLFKRHAQSNNSIFSFT